MAPPAGFSLGGSHGTLWFFTERFAVGFGLFLCLVGAIPDLGHVFARWLYIDNEAFSI